MPRTIRFTKAQAHGNDFLLVDARLVPSRDAPALARAICDRHFGIGGDGLILTKAAAGASRVTVRILNADGSEAAISGNGVRCAAAWLLERRSGALRPISIVTRAGSRRVIPLERKGHRFVFRTEMGKPIFVASRIPFAPARAPAQSSGPLLDCSIPIGDEVVYGSVLSVGNPHCVLFLEDFEMTDWLALGRELECHPFFPERTNVEFVRVKSPSEIEVRFYERGVGMTLASGTGSCAAAVASHLARGTEREVAVHTLGGVLHVHWREDGILEQIAQAEIVATGTFYSSST